MIISKSAQIRKWCFYDKKNTESVHFFQSILSKIMFIILVPLKKITVKWPLEFGSGKFLYKMWLEISMQICDWNDFQNMMRVLL